MSYRFLSGPDRALASRLQTIQSDLRQVEKRVRWTGAHRMVEKLDETVLPNIEVISSAADWANVISLTVGEGRWVLFATTTVTATQNSTDPFYQADYAPAAEIRSGVLAAIASSRAMFRFDWQGSGSYAARCLPLTSAVIEVAATTTFTLRAAMVQPTRLPPEPFAAATSAKMSRLQAVPL